MAISKTEAAYHSPNVDEARDEEKSTSITAHIVRTISVSMSVTEMDALVNSLGKPRDSLTNGEKIVQDEFVRAVERVRF